MPELPEVETICRGIAKPLTHATCQAVIVRQPKLRWPIPDALTTTLPGLEILAVQRRAKYLLLTTQRGTVLIHLGMSGTLRLFSALPPPQKHDHVDFVFDHVQLRYTDPRRFGAILFCDSPDQHPLLQNLGPEPLSAQFNPSYLANQIARKKSPIKTCLMDSKIVVGIGNIYANEALFLSQIHPQQPAATLSNAQLQTLCQAIKLTLKKAIKAGGTTLKDFQTSEGKPGYFSQQLTAYGRENLPCLRCETPLQRIILCQRATVFCPQCQRR